MNVIVDTSVWSLSLRKKGPSNQTLQQSSTLQTTLQKLIQSGNVVLLGAIRQELLSGIRFQAQYNKLKTRLRAFPDLPTEIEDYELAAQYFNTCRQNGVQGSNTDFLICAAARRRNYSILTADKDFEHFSQHIPINFFPLNLTL